MIVSSNGMYAQIARFPLLATLIQQKRCKGGVIVVDAGSRFWGNPYVDHALEKGELLIRLIDEVGYDVSMMGNMRLSVICKEEGLLVKFYDARESSQKINERNTELS